MTDATRRRTRVQTGHAGFLICRSQRMAMRTRNLSLKGLLCEVASPPLPAFAPDQPCVVEFPLGADLRAEVEGVITRMEPDRNALTLVAVDFTGMDPDSYAHLRNLVRFSAPDADAIDQEELQTPFST
ncbi:PilZ domain-containing protein [Megalodesulfovibrio gigas]|uniref:Putative type IV pilus assembly PilZ n=1 Tax=Megalodesulfovibrio gigas (strain ATCC 19364 / DSM 1382 / NCIMB 9332 / VKM B-1759) TaxID=1121448 RepID=T2GDI5_MEGG1|nr:PilZ domain-containing protein [Megalodesulfovibrio gigas]AGW14234.1 putative type IV pilus assembly PilZ [Megalodesulfovibrio gigas DSM 1382 = ATCC 19364]